jgi:hypothetical protein
VADAVSILDAVSSEQRLGEAPGPLVQSPLCCASEPHYLRDDAVGALDELADDETRRALVPLALDPQPDDPDDEIKGRALEAVCPPVLAAVDVLPGLTAPKNSRLIGAYRMFLLRVLPAALTVEELPAALQWAGTVRESSPLAPPLAGLADAIIARAWAHLDQPGMPEAIWMVLLPRLRRDGDLLKGDDLSSHEETFRDARSRRRLLPLLAADVRDGALQPFWALDSVPALLSSEDVDWLLERAQGQRTTRNAPPGRRCSPPRSTPDDRSAMPYSPPPSATGFFARRLPLGSSRSASTPRTLSTTSSVRPTIAPA